MDQQSSSDESFSNETEIGSSAASLPDDTGRTRDELTPRTRLDPDASAIDITCQPVIGRYTLLEEIGRGGMGTVYSAQQDEPVRRKVAVKVINPGMNSRDILARFEAERQALAMMDHPNIASVFDGGTTQAGLSYFVMELVQGDPITRYCRTIDLNLRDRLALFVDLCRAIHHAHQRGIIHRDLKPSNILVAEHDRRPVVKVIDFGVAKALRGELTERTVLTYAWQLIGTPIYMSPEQATRHEFDVDTRSDVYSLGVVLYELLTGTTPIERATLSRLGIEAFCRIVAQEDPQRPSERIGVTTLKSASKTPASSTNRPPVSPKQLKGELDWIVMRAIARDREHRYASASEFADDVQRYLNGEPVIASPPSLNYRMRKTAYQHRVALSILAVVMIALSAVAVISRWQLSAVELARQETELREQHAIDLLHALKLQGALTAFRNERFDQLHEITAGLRSDPLLSDRENRPTHLINLLNEAARRPARASFSNTCSVHDIVATSDQKQAVSVDEKGDVKLWNIDSPEDRGQLLGSHGEPAHAVAVSPDDQFAVTGSTSGELRYWNLLDRALIRTLKPVQNGIETLRWSPDGQTVAAGSRYSQVWVGDAEGNERFRIANDHRHESLLFSDDGSELIIPNRKDIGVYDSFTGQKRRSISTQPLSNVRTICFAGENNQWLIAGERYRESLVVLEYSTGRLLAQLPLGRGYARAICSSKNGLWLRVSYSGGQIQIIQLSPRERGQSVTGTIWSEYRAHAPAPDDRLPLAFLADNSQFMSAGVDGRIYVWEQHDLPAVEIRQPPAPIFTSYLDRNTGDIYHIHASKQHPFLAQAQAFSEQLVHGIFAVALNKKIFLVRAEDRSVIAEVESPLTDHREVTIADGGDVLVAGSTNALCVWETSNSWSDRPRVKRFAINHHSAPVLCDNGRTMIVDDEDKNQLVAINVATRSVIELSKIPQVNHLSIGPREQLVGIVFNDGFRIIDRTDRKTILQTDNAGSTGQLRFTHDGVVVLDCRRDGHVHVWHLPTRQELGLLYRPRFAIGTMVRSQLTHRSPRMMLEFASDYGGTRLLLTPRRPARRH